MAKPHGKAPATKAWRQFCRVVDDSSQTQVAAAIGISQQTVSRYYHLGTRPTWPRRQRIRALWGILEIDWSTADERRYAEAS